VSIKIGSRSPWGKVDHVSDIAPGIQSCSTPGHGGFKLDRKHNEKVPAPFRQKDGWYEGDCLYAVVLVTFPAYFTPAQVEGAHKTLKSWYHAKANLKDAERYLKETERGCDRAQKAVDKAEDTLSRAKAQASGKPFTRTNATSVRSRRKGRDEEE
jgi:hypothetical protein